MLYLCKHAQAFHTSSRVCRQDNEHKRPDPCLQATFRKSEDVKLKRHLSERFSQLEHEHDHTPLQFSVAESVTGAQF